MKNKFNIIRIIIITFAIITGCKNESISNFQNEKSVAEATEINIWKDLNNSERRGKLLFDQYCIICHGKTGEGDGFNSYNLKPKLQNLRDSTYINAISDSFLNQIISLGGRGVNKSSQMPSYRYILNENEIKSIVKYIRKLNKEYSLKEGGI